jgi:quercetin dioxygenase-like cupin family protein
MEQAEVGDAGEGEAGGHVVIVQAVAIRFSRAAYPAGSLGREAKNKVRTALKSWLGTRCTNPAFVPAGATAQVSGAAAAPASTSKRARKRAAATAEPAEPPSKRKASEATAGGGMLALNPNAIEWVVQHPRGMISVSKSTTLQQLALRKEHVFTLEPGAKLKWDFAAEYHSECGHVTEGALTIQCRDTHERVVIQMGETVRIRRGLRCFLKNEGTTTMKKTYAVFDKDGNELVDFNHDADAPLGILSCDTCKKDTWYESFQVGTQDYCPKCLLEKATIAQRRAAQRQVFGEDAPCA